VRIYPDPVGRYWFQKLERPVTKLFVAFWFFLMMWFGIILSLWRCSFGEGVLALVFIAIPAGAFSMWLSVKCLGHDLWLQNRYRRAIDGYKMQGMDQVRFKSWFYVYHYKETWGALPSGRYRDDNGYFVHERTMDHPLIQERVQWPDNVPAAPRTGSFWSIGQTLYWNKRSIEICRWDRLPYPVVFRDTAHQLPPSGVYQFKFDAPLQEINAASLDATIQIQILSGEDGIELHLMSGTFEMDRSPLALDIQGGKRELLDTESFLYFLRFADHYDWKCKEIKLVRRRHIEVTFYIDQKLGQAKENFNWNAAEPGYEFNEIEVDFWDKSVED
jgi:hypothetical protein